MKRKIIVIILSVFIIATTFLIIRDIRTSSYLKDKGKENQETVKVDNNKETKQIKVALIDGGLSTDNIVDNKLMIPHNILDNSKDISSDLNRGIILYNAFLNSSENKAQLLNIKAFENNTNINETEIVKALDYACDNDATIVNLSFNMAESKQVSNAIDTCHSKGISVVAQAKKTSSGLSYPASYQNVISVSRVSDKLNTDIKVDTTMQVGCGNEKCYLNSNLSLSTFLATIYLSNYKDKTKEAQDLILKSNSLPIKINKQEENKKEAK